MRRHVENQIERPEKEILGMLILCVTWALAFLALSSAARGQESQPASEAANLLNPANPSIGGDAEPRSRQSKSTQKKPLRTAGGPAEPKQDSSPNDEVTLTRFILISIPDRQLALVDNGQVVKVYSISVGTRRTPSPEGDFTIVSHVANPTWSHQGQVIGPGKDNPVGSRWMGLSLKGYGIHGTNAPTSIGKAASHGCFRMGKKDVEELFTLVRVGDTVAIRAKRDELVTQVFGNGKPDGEVVVASAAADTGTASDAAEDQ
jgi:lipoprotein-anchoring transpeptidase ErfK/SrfK